MISAVYSLFSGVLSGGSVYKYNWNNFKYRIMSYMKVETYIIASYNNESDIVVAMQ